uniref:Uncharacterized protein n=1 Tax=Trypanosoma brucei brucei (strain 927/4 GUTat10.1) TaxID=185431 RepID=Q4FKI8_TRYB2|nr:hypothetical protein Tb10.v4.0258 [Trypanosoma brucei brucei TREU927]
MDAGLIKFKSVIKINESRKTKGSTFTDSLCLLMALKTGPAVVTDSILRRICNLIINFMKLRVAISLQFVFSHCEITRDDKVDELENKGSHIPQTYHARITNIVTGMTRQLCNHAQFHFAEGRGPNTHRSTLLNHIKPTRKKKELEREGESLLAQFRTWTSKHFGWLHRVITRKVEELECRWCTNHTGNILKNYTATTQNNVKMEENEECKVVIATRQNDHIICPV